MKSLELWGGLECTVNRVGDQYFDQCERNGHAARTEDLDLFAGLGIKALRYPVLWERACPEAGDSPDWTWADERLGRLRELGVRPIVGLVHHGSGPRYAGVHGPAFAEGLARFAGMVAERYPWVDAYTPINEPLTTARFTGLYGHWHPHGRDDSTFARILLNECRAVTLSMRAIREVNPRAYLVQTEDLGKTFSTSALAYQARFDNERRWLSFDLLCGRVGPGHAMWGYLLHAGVSEVELRWFMENPCPPDILGANYYVTGERFLDERLELYPSHTHGGNGRHAYADLEAVRVRARGLAGPGALLRETWERYSLPIAITEAHNGCTREEQMRWFMEVWNAAKTLREEGADVRAVTAWSLLGAYDWNSLLTANVGYYEPGVFDMRSGAPRPTALARMLRELAEGQTPSHPTLSSPGWWRRDMRLIHGVSVVDQAFDTEPKRSMDDGSALADVPTPMVHTPSPRVRRRHQPLVIAGATGTLGKAFERICEVRGLPYVLLSRRELDICKPGAAGKVLDDYKPWAVVNAAGYVRVDDAEREAGACYKANAEGPAMLATACAARGAQLLTFSSDLVFDGSKGAPYVESDQVSPLNVYGRSKADAEALVLRHMPGALVVRTSAFFGPWDEHNFVTIALREMFAGKQVHAGSETVSPTYVPDLVNACLDLLIDGESGIWHLASEGAVTWAELAEQVAQLAGLDASLVRKHTSRDAEPAARRPTYSVLASERGRQMPTLESALKKYFEECQVDWKVASEAPVDSQLPTRYDINRGAEQRATR